MKKSSLLTMLALMLLVVGALVVLPANKVKAEELIDSTGSDYTDESVGRDETQDKDTVYDEVNISTTEHTSQAEVVVYVTRASKVQYKIPQVLIGGSNGSATYKVGVKGDISATQTVSIVPPQSFILTDGVREITASISQPKTAWVYSDLSSNLDEDGYAISVGTLSYSIPAGSFRGSFNFNISVVQSQSQG